MYSKRDSCSEGQAKTAPRFGARKFADIFLPLVFVMTASGGVRGLFLAACIGICAALERDEIGEQLKRDKMNESSEKFIRFRNYKNVLGGNLAVCGWRHDRGAQHFQFAAGAQNLARAIVGGF